MAASSAEFVVDAGPDFDPRHAPPVPAAELEEPAGPLEEWDEARIREFVTMGGETLHMFLAVSDAGDEETWLATERDLNAIVPPATRIANRYDAIRAAAAAGDEVLLAAALSRYAVRNYTKRRRYLAALAEQAPRPITGVPADPVPEPEDDSPEWLTAPPALTPKGARR